MSGNKFSTPIIEKDAFLSSTPIIISGGIRDAGNEMRGDSEPRGKIKLWRAVVAQAFIDGLSNSKKAFLMREKERAIAWLLGKSEDFYMVCSLADLNPEFVNERADSLFGKGAAKVLESEPEPSLPAMETKSWMQCEFIATSLLIPPYGYKALAASECY